MTVKSVDQQGAIETLLDAGATLVTSQMKTGFTLWTGRRRKTGIGHQRSNPAATPFFCDEPSIQSERPQACDIGDVTVGPVTHQDFPIKVVGCRNQGGMKTRVLQEGLQMLTYLPDELIGFNISHGPGTGGEKPCPCILFLEIAFKGEKEGHHGSGGRKKFSGQGVPGVDNLPEPGKEGIIGSRKANKGLFPFGLRRPSLGVGFHKPRNFLDESFLIHEAKSPKATALSDPIDPSLTISSEPGR
jgi:hypothetical protein